MHCPTCMGDGSVVLGAELCRPGSTAGAFTIKNAIALKDVMKSYSLTCCSRLWKNNFKKKIISLHIPLSCNTLPKEKGGRGRQGELSAAKHPRLGSSPMGWDGIEESLTRPVPRGWAPRGSWPAGEGCSAPPRRRRLPLPSSPPAHTRSSAPPRGPPCRDSNGIYHPCHQEGTQRDPTKGGTHAMAGM